MPLSIISDGTLYAAYVVAFALSSVACLVGAWKARSIPYADTRRGLVALLGISAVWALTYTGFFLSETRIWKNVFYQSSLIVGFGAIWAWLWFCSAYTGRSLHRTREAKLFAASVFVVVTALKLANPLHELYYTLEPSGGPFGLVVRHGVLYWVVMGVSYALATAGYLMMYELFIKVRAEIRSLAIVTALTSLPAVLNILGHVSPAFRDITHEPLGVAVFSIGLLYAYTTEFSAVRVTGSIESPNLVVDHDQKIRGLGGGAPEVFQRLDDSSIGKPLESVLPGLALALKDDTPIWERDHEEGTRYYRLLETSLEGTSGSKIIVLTDVTQRERQRRRLDRQNDLFEQAQSLAGVGAWEYDLETGQLHWTDQTYQIYGVSRDFEPTLEKIIKLTCKEDQPKVREALGKVVEEGVPQDIEVRLAGPESAESVCGESGRADPDEDSPPSEHLGADQAQAAEWVRIRGVPRGPGMQDSEGTGARGATAGASSRNGVPPTSSIERVRGAVQNITEQKRRERQLRDAKEQAEQASSMKTAMLANMSHEIRTPLTSIIGFAEAISNEIGRSETGDADSSALSHFAGLIEQSGRRLMDTLDGVLNLSKLQSGEASFDQQVVDLGGEAKSVAREFERRAEEAGVDLRVETGDAPVKALADAGGAKIVLQNLVSNAIKYTDEGGHVAVRVYTEGESAVLEVEDDGIGMDPELTPQLFEPFRQESEGVDREFEGSGVGLAVTRQAVDRMDGNIDVDTEKGEGSRFIVRLPAEEKRHEALTS